MYYQVMSAVVADETTGGSCTRSGVGIPGASPKGSENGRREISETAGDLTGERKGKVPEARERDVGKGKDGGRMGGWREIGDDDVGGVRGDRVCLFVAWCEGGVEWQVWR